MITYEANEMFYNSGFTNPKAGSPNFYKLWEECLI